MAAPVHVSPLIKFCRWSFLTAGIVYGFDKHRKYSAEEAIFRIEDEKIQRERKAYLAKEKERLNAATMAEFEAFFYGKPTPEQSVSPKTDSSNDISSDTNNDTSRDAKNESNETNDRSSHESSVGTSNESNIRTSTESSIKLSTETSVETPSDDGDMTGIKVDD